MRRTEQEFKEEILRRTRAYRQEQARKRKKLLGAGICVCLCCVVLAVFDPFGAASEAPAVMDNLKMESAVSMQMAGGTDSGIIADEVPAEFAAAPMAPPAAEEAKSGQNRMRPERRLKPCLPISKNSMEKSPGYVSRGLLYLQKRRFEIDF